MKIRHHLSDPLLMAYSSGDLPEAFNLVIAAHVSLCDECRARLEAFEALGGAVIEEQFEEMSAGSLEACLAKIDDLPMVDTQVARTAEGILPAPLVDYVGGGLDKVKWRSVGMGVKQAILNTSEDGASVRLLAIPGGATLPNHGHNGLEMTLVLQGAFSDASDRFGPGDLEIADDTMQHTPVAETGAVCICLTATQGKLRFNALLPRMVQSIFRI
ncbi:MAG: ChrR family anti-sigma-E factor [Rhodobacteraceae bacterium]|jgi:putative transcriptional regulator|nr:ChrR family anti-sigma-E factor [Paracoccaceae bacterium]MCF8512837.1 ChrR family anti-sigma-E factor [Paracoccaceae bacterium]MCF8517082.1 ChrR family anti-sigma-E factor [Paracoccaceae bacterium]